MERGRVTEQCEGCNKITVQGNECIAYMYPEIHWRNGKKCPLATHISRETVELKLINPLRASKAKYKVKR